MPENFDSASFEQLMARAVTAHDQKRFEDALQLSEQAYILAPDASFEKGRAAREIMVPAMTGWAGRRLRGTGL